MYLLTVELAEGPGPPGQVAEHASSAVGPDADHRRAAQSELEPERHSSSATPRPHTVVIDHWLQRLMKQALAGPGGGSGGQPVAGRPRRTLDAGTSNR
jgi:hypothetical protein